MHELSIAQNIVEIIRKQVPEKELPDVSLVRLQIGDLAGIVCDSLEFCYGVITTNTVLQNSKLEIDRIPARVFCRTCQTVSSTEPSFLVCPACGSGNVKLESGTELQVSEIELNTLSAEIL
ncbi:MAG: hydrogenase maturation nickel metallochaperone HypA [Ignavibacteriales bacterium]|nr:hydrogenase maturation nickel metallochaperone HypA [Ignavibacteriales bacterium]